VKHKLVSIRSNTGSILLRKRSIERLNKIAKKEGNAKKPIYQIHKWWARRLGSVLPDDTVSVDLNIRLKYSFLRRFLE